ncbi:MAG: hypothetical protein DMF53_07645 [Acidobacteria bacterium]|nr:MAG: hypothetical protein DMF53_07645 [Acidobacteriota bacterium]
MKRLLFVLAVVGSFSVALPASADCVKCDIFHDCVPDVQGTGCDCTIKVIKGSTFCRENGICTGDGSNCGSGLGPVIAASGIVIEPAALSQFFQREPLLALLISGSLQSDPKGRAPRLNTEPYDGGTLRTENGQAFYHRGQFALKAAGEVAFRFTLNNADGLEKIQYVGVISDRGRSVTFSKIVTDAQGTSHRLADEWHYEPIQK